MTVEQIIKEFGTVTAAAKALGVSRQTIYLWRRAGELPRLRQMQAEVILRERSDGQVYR